jgi:hypothetical protein
MSDGPPIIQYWHDEDIPSYIQELLGTVQAQNPNRRRLLFNEQTADELIAEHFGERELDAFRSCAVPAMQADYFRYCAVSALGGIYLDADFGCYRSLDSLLKTEGRLFKHPNGPVVNGFFGFRSAGHPLLAMTVEIATSSIEARWTNNVGFVTGPLIFSGLDHLRHAGSFDRLRGTLGEEWGPALDVAKKAVEIHGPIEKAFDGVCVSSRATMESWIRVPDQHELLYKQGGTYWSNWKGSIYRPAKQAPR